MHQKKKIKIMILPILVILLLSGCGQKQSEQENQNMNRNHTEAEASPATQKENPDSSPEQAATEKNTDDTYEHITQEEAKNIMENDGDAIILDVRTQKEYDTGHIKDAVLIPYDQVSEEAEENLPDKEQTILVYCRSGNRSRQAAETLAELGYTDIREFGGIMTWPYEIEMPEEK